MAIGTYLLHGLTLDISNGEIAGLLALRAGGMGLAMMPVMTGGVAAVPPNKVGAASAFNNVAQRSAAALGLAILTALMTSQQAAMLEDRTSLIGADTPMPGSCPDRRARWSACTPCTSRPRCRCSPPPSTS